MFSSYFYRTINHNILQHGWQLEEEFFTKLNIEKAVLASYNYKSNGQVVMH